MGKRLAIDGWLSGCLVCLTYGHGAGLEFVDPMALGMSGRTLVLETEEVLP
jgi:hypothetical protein